MRKRLTAIILVIAMTFSLSACNLFTSERSIIKDVSEILHSTRDEKVSLDEALALCEEAIEKYDSAEAMFLAGWIIAFEMYSGNDYEQAIEYFHMCEDEIPYAKLALAAVYMPTYYNKAPEGTDIKSMISEALPSCPEPDENLAYYPELCLLMGLICRYEFKWGVSVSDVSVMDWFSRAAEAGNCTAMLELAEWYSPQSVEDYDSAREWYYKAVEAGSTKAMAKLGYIYYYGSEELNIDQDYDTALDYFLDVGELADADIYIKIADIYYGHILKRWNSIREDYEKSPEEYEYYADNISGRTDYNVSTDWDVDSAAREQAASYYIKAAEALGEDSCYSDAVCFENSYRALSASDLYVIAANLYHDIYYDSNEAEYYTKEAEYYTKAAESGNAGGYIGLARLSNEDEDIEKNLLKAADIMQAGDYFLDTDNELRGICTIYYYLGELYMFEDGYKAIEYYLKAIEYGGSPFIDIAQIYERGLGGVEPDGEKAISYYLKEVNSWDKNATWLKIYVGIAYEGIAEIYDDGIGGVKKDAEKAKSYYTLAENYK